MRLQHATSASKVPAGVFRQSGAIVQQRGRRRTLAQRRQLAGRCAIDSMVASTVFTFMRTVRLSFAPRIA
ncbi:hypothetical protein FHR51_001098 [Xanthomonas arboricola]|nr:hypothetical protein [Xanthomonas cannabis]MBB3804964.1 hypothetical protein [Xanthomonas cannabis]